MTKERELLREVVSDLTDYGDVSFRTLERIENLLADSTPSDDIEEPTKIEIAAEREDIDWQSNEGAIYLFAGWLTTRDTIISCGRTENAAPMAEAIKEYKAEWPDRFTKPAEPAARKPMTEEEINRYLDNECLADFDARIFKWAISIAEKHHGITNES